MTAPLAILVVDDEPAIRRALERALKRGGHTVFLATTGDVGLDVLANQPVDVVLMDLRMPGMSGQTLFHSIVARWPHLVERVIVMTGDLEAVDHCDWLKANHLPILMKPFELTQLDAMLDTIARRQQHGRSQA